MSILSDAARDAERLADGLERARDATRTLAGDAEKVRTINSSTSGPPWRGNTGPSITPPPDNFTPPRGNPGTADLGPASSQPPRSATDPRWGNHFDGWIWTGTGYRRDYDYGKPKPDDSGPHPGDYIPGATWNPVTQRYTIDRQPGQTYLPPCGVGPILGPNGLPANPNNYTGIGSPGGPSSGYVGIGSPGGPSGNMRGSSSSGGGGGGGIQSPWINWWADPGGHPLGDGPPSLYNPSTPTQGYGKSGGPVPTADTAGPIQVRLLADMAGSMRQVAANTRGDNGAGLRAKGLL